MGPPRPISFWTNPANSYMRLPNITTAIDVFSKSLYSLVLSDFGVTDQTNALVTPEGVKWLQRQVDEDLKNQTSVYGRVLTGRPQDVGNAVNRTGPLYPINHAYQSVVKDLGSPPKLSTTQTSSFFVQYLCAIPRMKGGGALIFAVLHCRPSLLAGRLDLAESGCYMVAEPQIRGSEPVRWMSRHKQCSDDQEEEL